MMARTLLNTVFIFLVIQLATARKLTTHSRVIFTEDSSNNKWTHLGNNLFYHSVEFPTDGSSKIIHNVKSLENVFGNSNQYNCTYELDKNNYGERPFSVMQRQALPNHKVNVLTPVYKSGKVEWRLVIADLTTCKLTEHVVPYTSLSMSYEETSNSVFFANTQLCGMNYCKVTLDSEKKVTKYPVERIQVSSDEMLTIRQIQYTEYYLLTQQDLDRYRTRRVSLLDKSGVKILAQCAKDCGLTVLYAGPDGVILYHLNEDKSLVYIERYDLIGDIRRPVMNFFIPKALTFEGMVHPSDGGYEVIFSEVTGTGRMLRINRYDWYGKPISRLVGIDGFEEPNKTGYTNTIQTYKNQEDQWCLIQKQKKSSAQCKDADCFVMFEKCLKEEDFEPF